MQAGEVVEQGIPDYVISESANPYTQLLVNSVFPVHPDNY